MLCEKCKKNTATYHYRQNVNGKVTELHLCADCASHTSLPTEDPFTGLFPSLLADILPAKRRTTRKVCPVCGSTEEQIMQSGYAGCSVCYDTFAGLFAPYIAKLHGRVIHRGRTPKNALPEESPQEKARIALKKLQNELQEAISAEDFERAAKLRDQIRAKKAEAGEQ